MAYATETSLYWDDEFETLIVVPPDGGWGWVVVVTAFVSNMVADGISYTFGLFLDDLTKAFNVSVGNVTIVGSVMSGSYYLMGPFVSALVNRYGFRVVVITGGIIAAAGFAIGSFTENFPLFVFCSGFMTGTGLGMITMPAVIVVGFYFEKWRAIATGIATCGSGIGTVVTPPVINFLRKYLDWRNIYRVLAGSLIVVGLMSLLYRPLKPVKVFQREMEIKNILPESVATVPEKTTKCLCCTCRWHPNTVYPTTAEIVPPSEPFEVTTSDPSIHSEIVTNRTSLRTLPESIRARLSRQSTFPEERCCSCCGRCIEIITCSQSVSRPLYRDDIFFGHSLHLVPQYRRTAFPYSEGVSMSGDILRSVTEYHMSVTRVTTFRELYGDRNICSCPIAILRTLSTMLDCGILKSYAFLLFAFSGWFIVLGYLVPYYYIMDRAIEGGVDPKLAYWLLSAIGAANTAGRIISGILPSVTNLKVIEYSVVCIAITGISTICSGLYMAVWFQFGYACLYGIAGSCIATLRPVIVVELFGLEHLTNAFGLQMMFMGVAAVLGTILAGIIYDQTQNYNASFYLAGANLLISALLLTFIRRVRMYERRHSRIGSI